MLREQVAEQTEDGVGMLREQAAAGIGCGQAGRAGSGRAGPDLKGLAEAHGVGEDAAAVGGDAGAPHEGDAVRLVRLEVPREARADLRPVAEAQGGFGGGGELRGGLVRVAGGRCRAGCACRPLASVTEAVKGGRNNT